MPDATSSGPRPRLRSAFIAVAVGIAPGVVVMAALVADAFVTPTLHEVHTPGGVAVNAAWVYTTDDVRWVQGRASQSLADMRCQLVNASGTSPCDGAIAAGRIPNLEQEPNTLYSVWTYCGGYPKASFTGEGQNVEYISASRTLVVHCYSAKPWLDARGPQGVSFEVRSVLLAVPTAAMGSGLVHIFEDDRIEHLFGDQSDEYLVATATIS